MESFDKVFGSTFADPSRTIANTFGGFLDHMVRFEANLPTTGPFVEAVGEALNATINLGTKARDLLLQAGRSLSTQKEATLQTEAAAEVAFERIRNVEAALSSDLFIEDEAERRRLRQLLFPTGGLQFYTTAKLATELPDRLSVFLAITEAEAAALGPKFVLFVQRDLGPFRTIREQQLAAFSKTGDARGDVRKLIDQLNEQCDFNKNLLSAHFRTDLGRVALFWKASFYARAATRAATGQLLNLGIKATHRRQLYDLADYPTANSLMLTLREGGPLCLYRADKTTAAMPSTTLPVPIGATSFVTPLAAIPGTGPHLLAYNDTGRVVHLDAQLS